MNYYKLIRNNEIFAVIKDPSWVFINRRGRLVACDSTRASGIVSQNGDYIYHINGRPAIGDNYESIDVADITEDEFMRLGTLFECGATVTDNEVIEWADEVQEDEELPVDETIEKVRTIKLSMLSECCHNAIINGAHVKLPDGTVAHFEMSIVDQLNLMELYRRALNGEDVPYHASGELCRLYSPEEIKAIWHGLSEHKCRETAYFNCLKNMVNQLTSIVEIGSVAYGDRVPAEYCSDYYLENYFEDGGE